MAAGCERHAADGGKTQTKAAALVGRLRRLRKRRGKTYAYRHAAAQIKAQRCRRRRRGAAAPAAAARLASRAARAVYRLAAGIALSAARSAAPRRTRGARRAALANRSVPLQRWQAIKRHRHNVAGGLRLQKCAIKTCQAQSGERNNGAKENREERNLSASRRQSFIDCGKLAETKAAACWAAQLEAHLGEEHRAILQYSATYVITA